MERLGTLVWCMYCMYCMYCIPYIHRCNPLTVMHDLGFRIIDERVSTHTRQCQCARTGEESAQLTETNVKKSSRLFFGSPSSPSPPGCDCVSTTQTPPVTRLQNTTNCGETPRRIVGGTNMYENEMPWLCSVMDSSGNFAGCGATLLGCNPTIVVSAAHCFPGGASNKKISCGGHDINRNDVNEQTLDIGWISIHPEYNNGGNYENDIAVIKTRGTFNCQQHRIWPACLPSAQGLTYSGWKDTVAAGWGTTAQGGSLTHTPRKVTLPPVSDTTCKAAMEPPLQIDGDSMICAGAPGGDSCQGDSGGPLVTQKTGEGWSLIGIASSGIGCARPGTYGIYTEVSNFLDWIAEQYGLLPV